MNRSAAFESLAEHPMLGRLVKKLKKDELLIARTFLEQTKDLSAGEFERAVNRMHLDRARTKNWTIIEELLMCAKSAAK